MAKINSVQGKSGKISRSKKTETKSEKKNNTKKRLNNKIDSKIRSFEVLGIIFTAFALIAMCGFLNFNVGFVGLSVAKILYYLFGVGAWPASVAVFMFGGYLILQHELPKPSIRLLGSLLFFIFVLGCFHHFTIATGKEILPESLPAGGGLLGGGILFVIRKFLGETGSIILLTAASVAALLAATGWSLAKGIFFSKEKAVQGVDYAKDKIETGYQNIVEMETKLRNRSDESFYDQEKDSKYTQQSNADLQGAVVKQSDYVQEEVKHTKKPLPRITNEHSIIEPPDWGESVRYEPQSLLEEVSDAAENNTVEETREIEEIAAEQENTYDVEQIAIEAEASEEISATMEDVCDSVIIPLPEETEAIIENPEDDFVKVTEEKEAESSVPAFTIQYSRSDETDDEINAGESDENILSSEANSQLDVADKDFHQATTAFTDNVDMDDKTESEPSADAAAEYIMPKVSELLNPPNKHGHAGLELEIAENAEILAKTLEDFKVKANIINACHGPAVTRYELTPAPGVKVSKITGLSQDLALALAAVAVRIEPVPGKAAIGVEVPNKVLESVPLCEVLQSKEFMEAESPLTVGLGMDISGHAITADLGKMPHLLVAGATGSGKSVCVNTLITSILFKARPDEVKFILIDPKMVELSNYNGIPHLMVPVVTDMRKAASVLNWAVQEMEKRYAKFAAAGARDMARYNKLSEPKDKIPAVVIIIDELADLMMVAPHDVEDAIFRLAQKARAAGIHLVLATQRPSVDVITGTIKSNIPSRISFAVSSQVDSRTILDDNGAEMLLGKGDMLFLPMGASKAQRVQGAFISDDEVEALLDFIRNQGQEMKPDEEVLSFTENVGCDSKNGQEATYDVLLPKAVELVINTGSASTTNLQRRFHIGYGRAAGLIDVMEELSIVGPRNGSKPREILVTAEEARALIGL